MGILKRSYEKVIRDHLTKTRQMVFLVGPQKAGKTVLAKAAIKIYSRTLYLNWKIPKDREIIRRNIDYIIDRLDLNGPSKAKRVLILDEIHHFKGWQQWVKGFFDKYHPRLKIIVTGSARLDTMHKASGGSMMGRYFLYRIHPFTVAELLGKRDLEREITKPKKINPTSWNNLLTYGGFPEPYVQGDPKVFKRWSRMRHNQLLQGDIRSLTNIQEVAQLELLAQLLTEQAGSQTVYAKLGLKVQVSSVTIKRWLETLASLYYCFSLKPWSKNVTRSLLQEKKFYLWDWSQVEDTGARHENFIASHLLKATHYWTDIGLGDYELYYIRDKERREVDFLVTKDRKPWFLVEVKSSRQSLSSGLQYFFEKTGAQHAFQVTMNMPYTRIDCFSHDKPVIVPASTFLSQLV